VQIHSPSRYYLSALLTQKHLAKKTLFERSTNDLFLLISAQKAKAKSQPGLENTLVDSNKYIKEFVKKLISLK
jgi:hypothetical protein